ncbi:MAG: lipid-A-disaccharide synthase [Fibrobacter sp.]|nr:lipid-A-disaccharide synthase [Fibrobacter sp.]
MTSDKPYILFCAGEDSGDSLGKSLVFAARKIAGDIFDFWGSGGKKMESAGLKILVNFEELPVSGFGDVFPRYFRLRKCFGTLKNALENSRCKGLVAIDYPGFNMKLTALANRLGKPVLYVAPPQAWAWKPKRAKRLSHPTNRLALFFDFEESPYEKNGCNILRMEHPLVTATKKAGVGECLSPDRKGRILLFPGSRKSQTFRNLPLFLNLVKDAFPTTEIVVVASRAELKTDIDGYLQKQRENSLPKNLQVMVAPQNIQERLRFFSDSSLALSSPGTVTLELALADCNTVVCTKPDFLTYAMGRRLIKTKWFSLPNLILGKDLFSEYIAPGNAEKLKDRIRESLLKNYRRPLEKNDVDLLRQKLQTGISSEQLMSEFLAQFLKGQP